MSKYLSEKSQKKSLTLMASLALVLAISVVGTVAYLVTNTDPVVNTFTPATPSIKVEETLNEGEKSDVKVTNTGEVPMYIRAVYVVEWKNEEGKVVAMPAGAEVNVVMGDWTKKDGYWYYPEVLEAGKTTVSNFIKTATVTIPKGYTVDIEILAQGIQAEPDQAVIDAWGFVPGN